MTISYKDLFNLEGKTAIVTGALGILGKKFCYGLAEFGANVAIVDLDEELAEKFATALSEEYQVIARGIRCDVSSPVEVQSMVKSVVDKFGEVNILHNNAGGKSANIKASLATFEDYTLETWRAMMSVNIDGMFLVAQAVGKQMIEQGKGGVIVQTSSMYGLIAPDQRIYEGSQYMGYQMNSPASYMASKAAVIGLTKYLASYWADQRIRVNCLSPGGVESGQTDLFKQKYSARIPLGRMAQRDEMVGALIYLASDASSYVTGENIVIDGGVSVW
jgi:NAD(P)-dependent dehydrogenase (short-subunit alcohol dehydrogenase family)